MTVITTATVTPATTPLAASSAARLPNAPRRRGVGWYAAFSVLLHLALLVVAIVAAQHKRIVPQTEAPASVAMVFEGGGNAPPSIANPAPVSPNRPASPAPQPSAPPSPPVAQPPPPLPQPAVPQAPPATAPSTEITPPREVVPPQATPPVEEAAPPVKEATPPAKETPPPVKEAAPPTKENPPPVKEATPSAPEVAPPQKLAQPPPAPSTTPQPSPETTPPPSTAPAAQAPPPEALPLPPPVPAPAPEAASQPAPTRPPRPREVARPLSPPRPPSPAFPAPMQFSLGPRVAAPEATPPQPHASPGTIDMSFAPMMSGGDITQLHPQGKGDDVGEDWFNLVAAWWIRHRFYPNEAARQQQEGDVTLRLVVGRGGRVEAVDIEQRSGSQWLDLGALAVFRDATLPPLPPDVSDPNVTVQFTIHYIIIR
jgi:periplasmic protein TonB